MIIHHIFSSKRIQEAPNARHHPRPNSMNMRGSVAGRRVHAVVGRRVRFYAAR